MGNAHESDAYFVRKVLRPDNIPNLDIQWESQEQWNIGLDLGLLNDRVNITLDWYRKESKDMLMPLQLPSYMGTSGNVSLFLLLPMEIMVQSAIPVLNLQ